ncbi:MAG: hypothetical protein KIG95_03010 [Comamonas sp.]|nr:hypothetical protein [Comamonas sp.]
MLNPNWGARQHQGSGLHWLGQSTGVRIWGLVPSGLEADTQALWHMCAHLQSQGHPTLILDASTQESAATPGLQELLQLGSGFAHQALPATDTERHPDHIQSLPAARGLVQLIHLAQQQRQAPLQLLQRYVRNHALVLLVAPAGLMVRALAGVQHTPTVLVAARQNAVLACYEALKQIFMHTAQMPRLLALRPATNGLDPLLKAIASCALEHLHSEPLIQQIDPLHPRQLHRWALQCLEQAFTAQSRQELHLQQLGLTGGQADHLGH